MPELPDVESFRRYLNRTALHQTIARVSVTDGRVLNDTTPQALGRRLNGRRFETTRRRGKFLFAQYADDGWLVLHFGMTGSLDYRKTGDDVPKAAKVVLRFDNGRELLYKCPRMFGEVGLTESPDDFARARGLGPDAMDDALTKARFRELLDGRRGTVKSALMNQSILAGVGNIYADETLFQSGVRPDKSIDKIAPSVLDDIHRALRRVLRVATDHKADITDLPRGYVIPNRHKDGRCPKCDAPLKHTEVSGRTTWYCAKCQK